MRLSEKPIPTLAHGSPDGPTDGTGASAVRRSREGTMAGLRHCLLLCLLLFTPALWAQIDTERVIQLGRNALYFDDYLTAIRYFNQAIEAKPYLSKAYYYRAYAKFTLEDYHGAEADCSTSLELNPFITEVYKLRGLCRIHNRDFKGAAEDYSCVLQEEPEEQGAMYNRALCYIELKEYGRAGQDMDALLKRWPRFSKAYVIKAQIALEEKDTIAGLKWIDTLLVQNPKESSAWAFKGRYAIEKEEYALADSCLTQAIQLRPNDFDYYLSRALARNGMNRFSGALEDYDHVIEMVPEHFVAHYNRGLLRAQVGDDNRAIEDFDFVIKEEPDNTLALYNRALLREQTGDFRGAISDYSKLLEAYPNFTYGYMARARCRRKIGDIKGAKSDETKVYRADLDLMYGTGKKKAVKEVRKRSDKSLEKYQQLVAEDADTTHVLLNELFGKVQNLRAEKELLPMFSLSFISLSAKGYHSIAYLPEIEKINKTGITERRLVCTTELATKGSKDLQEAVAEIERKTGNGNGFLYSTIRSVTRCLQYDYQEALAEINKALAEDSLSNIGLMQRAYILTQIQATSALTNEADKISALPSYAAALADLDKAFANSPDNQYLPYNRGCLHAQQKKYAAALEDFNKAISQDARFAEAYYNRAVIYLLTGQNEKAIPDLSRAGEIGLYKAYNLLKQALRENPDKGKNQ